MVHRKDTTGGCNHPQTDILCFKVQSPSGSGSTVAGCSHPQTYLDPECSHPLEFGALLEGAVTHRQTYLAPGCSHPLEAGALLEGAGLHQRGARRVSTFGHVHCAVLVPDTLHFTPPDSLTTRHRTLQNTTRLSSCSTQNISGSE